MTTLRALVGAYSMVAFMGFVLSVPLGWTVVLGIAATSTEKIAKSRPYKQNDKVMQKKILPRYTYEQVKYKIVAKEKYPVRSYIWAPRSPCSTNRRYPRAAEHARANLAPVTELTRMVGRDH